MQINLTFGSVQICTVQKDVTNCGTKLPLIPSLQPSQIGMYSKVHLATVSVVTVELRNLSMFTVGCFGK